MTSIVHSLQNTYFKVLNFKLSNQKNDSTIMKRRTLRKEENYLILNRQNRQKLPIFKEGGFRYNFYLKHMKFSQLDYVVRIVAANIKTPQILYSYS